MEIQELKEYIFYNDKVEYVLEELGCHCIKYNKSKEYYTCAFPDGDNKAGLVIYNNEYLNAYSNTREIKTTNGGSPSLIDIVCYIKDVYLSVGIKWLCDINGLDYYSDTNEDLPESVLLNRMIFEMAEGKEVEEEEVLKPINPKILEYYKPYCNNLFFNDGIPYGIQRMFNVGYDLYSNRITIPIYDELGNCVGVKGRWFDKEVSNGIEKYIYLEPCAKSKVLYGLDKAYKYIKEKDQVIVVESEKSVMLAWAYGIRNVVAASGHNLSKVQVNKLMALGVSEIILCYDEDVGRQPSGVVSKKVYTKEVNKFVEQQKVTIMVDIKGTILNKKESPIDDKDKFDKMYNDRILLR